MPTDPFSAAGPDGEEPDGCQPLPADEGRGEPDEFGPEEAAQGLFLRRGRPGI
ncbi:MAG: hypothetical protein ABSA53_32955 [Streptosporangiaceae bacterium]